MSGTLSWTYSFVIPDQSISGYDTLSVTFTTSAVVDPSMGGYLATSMSGTVTGPGGDSSSFTLQSPGGFDFNDNYLYGSSVDGLDVQGISFSVDGFESSSATFNIFDQSGSFQVNSELPGGDAATLPSTGPNGTGAVQFSLGTLLLSGSYSDQALNGGDASETSDGATVTGVTLTGGADLLVLGGSVSNITVGSGSGLFIDGGAVSNVTLDGGTIAIGGGALTGGSFSALAISGTVALAGATLTASTIENGAELNVYAGAATGLTVANGGTLTLGGGTVSDTSVEAGGTEFVVGGTNSGNIIEDEALQSIASGATAFDNSVSTYATIGFFGGAKLDLTNEIWAAGDHVVLTDNHDGTDTMEIETAAGNEITSFDALLLGNVTGFSVVQGAENSQGLATLELVAEPVCYVAGTRILTVAGEVVVEDLRVGDLVVTRFGPLRPIKWIGRQSFAGVFLGQKRAPVCIRVGALGENLPRRDLFVSPGHRMAVDDVLVRAECLVNGITITQDATQATVEYYHIDFGVHDCVIAEGTWSESYAEQDNRATFHNVAEFGAAFPDHAATYQAECLPLAERDAATLAGVLDRVLRRVPGGIVTSDAGLHLVADGARIESERQEAGRSVFRVPAGTRSLRLRSLASRPSMVGINGDERLLGVRVHAVSADFGAVTASLVLASGALNSGWCCHEETLEGQAFRWTQGDAVLPTALLGNGCDEVVLTVSWGGLGRYFIAPSAEADAANRLLLAA